jgi:hypothetical protein
VSRDNSRGSCEAEGGRRSANDAEHEAVAQTAPVTHGLDGAAVAAAARADEAWHKSRWVQWSRLRG